MNTAETFSKPSLLKLRFSGELESAFQKEIYDNSRNFLRGASILFFLMSMAHIFRFAATQPRQFLIIPLSVMVIWGIVFGLTLLPNFWRHWQPVLALLLLTGMCFVEIGAAHNIQAEDGYAHLTARVSWLSASAMMFMVALSPVRLNFQWAALVYTGLTINCALICLNLYNAPLALVLDRFSLGIFIVVPALIYASYTHERLHRNAFLARHRLAEQEAAERSRRQQSESMLKVLSQAIGGIVHDLGNPLTLVQSGTQVLEMVIARNEANPKTIGEFLTIINNGALMLNHLRLSLMEQTRVLDGKPIPVDLKPALVRAIVEAGVRYQKPRFTAGRRIVVEGEDVRLFVDEMKLTTVFMNLIGNALKYSDGEVRVTWLRNGNHLLIAVQDQGCERRGLSREQAAHLFVAFGRLEEHGSIEGTGLGLLSAQRIAEAHGGEVFIEGHTGGTPESPLFSTAREPYPSLLEKGFCTAFVVVCPLPTSDDRRTDEIHQIVAQPVPDESREQATPSLGKLRD